ncbi:MAG: chemotaxis protein CheB [Sedimentisphaerales bacterium]|nr:chemotaxis protein CheB [Sedimentisphaerales bacterium]
MRKSGARTIAQDEASCVVFGMPREAINVGAAEKIVALDDVAKTMIEMVR